MRLFRFQIADEPPRVGMSSDDAHVYDLTAAGVTELTQLLETEDPAAEAAGLARRHRLRLLDQDNARFLCPLDRQEVWAAGVTYLRSKQARMEESGFSATAYDRVYEAARPELFFKAMAHKAVGPGDAIGIRADSRWTVPEPELALVLNSRGRLVGYTIGNDVSARDIEGENLLYLPQAKTYARSCALGPWVVIGVEETEARTWTVDLRIERDGAVVFEGATEIARIRRSFAELVAWLFRAQQFPHGAVLLTGTGVVPPDAFALAAGDRVAIQVSGIGRLENPVIPV